MLLGFRSRWITPTPCMAVSAASHIHPKSFDVGWRPWSVPLLRVLQRRSGDELGDDVRSRSFGVEVQHLGRAHSRRPTGGISFSSESRQEGWIRGMCAPDHLNGNKAPIGCVSLEDRSIPPSPR
jgi:hypothetical protein